MNKYSTCLTPFMFHLLSLFAKGSLTESAGNEYHILKNKDVSKASVLEKRKKTLLDETIELLSYNTEEREFFFDEKKNPKPCGLCMACIGCEQEYWQEVSKLLNSSNTPSEYNLPKEIEELLVQKEKPEEIYVLILPT